MTYSRVATKNTAYMAARRITKQQAIDAAAHWRKIANEQDSIADSETAQGLPHGDVSSYRARATLWHQIADDLKAQAEVM